MQNSAPDQKRGFQRMSEVDSVGTKRGWHLFHLFQEMTGTSFEGFAGLNAVAPHILSAGLVMIGFSVDAGRDPLLLSTPA